MERKDNSGALFKNDRKETDNHPDYNGNVTIGGEDYWISGWIKKSAAGKTYMSLSFKPKNAAKLAAQAAKKMSVTEQLEDEIPW